MPEKPSDQSESGFTPSVDAAELIAANRDPEALRRVESDRQEREAHRQQLLDRGYDAKEAASVVNSGYVLPDTFARQDPSEAYLADAAKQEAQRPPDSSRAQAKLDYPSTRAELIANIKHSAGSGYTDAEVERIATYGHLMPPEYSATPAQDLLDQKRQRESRRAA